MPHVTDQLYHMMLYRVNENIFHEPACRWCSLDTTVSSSCDKVCQWHAACRWCSLDTTGSSSWDKVFQWHATCHWQTLSHDEKTVVSREHHRHAACHWQTLSHDEETVVWMFRHELSMINSKVIRMWLVSRSYGSWMYNYPCNKYLSLCVWITLMEDVTSPRCRMSLTNFITWWGNCSI
jgi:hypothetical protein